MRRNKPILHDPFIINRVKEYLEDNVDKTYVDVSEMAKTLQKRFPEYMRRKNGPFRTLVAKAYRIVSESYASGDAPTTSNEDPDDDDDGTDSPGMDPNVVSNLMNNMYSKRMDRNSSASSAVGGSGSAASLVAAAKASEPIDISSDESDDEGPKNGFSNCAGGTQNASCIRNATGGKWGPSFETNPNKRSGAPTDLNEQKKRKFTKGFEVVPQKLDFLQHLENQRQIQNPQNPRHPSNQLCTGLTNKALPSALYQAAPHSLARFQSAFNPTVNNVATPKLSNANANSFTNYNQQQRQPQPQQLRSALVNQLGDRSGQPAAAGGARTDGAGGAVRARKYKKEVKFSATNETFEQLGGMEKILKELCEILMHIKSPDLYIMLGLTPPHGILLHGPSGCGKTLLARAIAGQLKLPLIEIPATEMIAGVSGESEERIRDVFEQATSFAPCVLFIDEIDSITSNRSTAQKDMERRVVSQLISCLDNLKFVSGKTVLVIGATTRPDTLDPALRRVGRFDHEIAIGIPTRSDRKDILSILCDDLCVGDFDFDKLAELTPGYVGADLLALVSRAASIAMKRICAIKFRALQSRQKEISYVDLDDDNDDTNEKLETASQAVDGETNGSGSAHPPPVVSSTETTAEGVTDDPMADSESTQLMEVPDEPVETAEKVETVKPVTAPDQAEQVADGPSNNEVLEKDVKNTAIPSKTSSTTSEDVTLDELISWLENPPEFSNMVSDVWIELEDFLNALKVVQPSAKREGFITVPDVTWDDVGSLQDIREELKLAVLAPVKHPKMLERLGLSAPSGVLLCGPPGCGKTLLAKAIANEAGINFISVKGPELMNMYVGESERAVRACFQRARNSAPCVIFFDEFDSLCPKRSDRNDSSAGTRVVNQLLTEMDGVEERRGVYILAATNRPDIIDPAILRPGRLDTILYVGLPGEADRREILNAATKNRTRPILADDVDFDELAAKTDGYTGADLSGLVQQSAMMALKESLKKPNVQTDDLCVRREHFLNAIKALRPSVSPQDRKVYEKLRVKYAAPPSNTEEPTTPAASADITTGIQEPFIGCETP